MSNTDTSLTILEDMAVKYQNCALAFEDVNSVLFLALEPWLGIHVAAGPEAAFFSQLMFVATVSGKIKNTSLENLVGMTIEQQTCEDVVVEGLQHSLSGSEPPTGLKQGSET